MSDPITAEVMSLADLIWNFLRVEDELRSVDGILCLGSSDIAVADWAARYYLDGWAPWIVFSGNVGRLTDGVFPRSEAETFAERARIAGVPDSAIFLESRSTNTGENVRFTKALLAEKDILPQSILVVQKPYMGKRALATMQQFWPEVTCLVRSTDITLESYLARWPNPADVVDLMVGDLQRMKIYPPLGYQAAVEISDEVCRAFEKLVSLGYSKQLVKS